MLIALLDIFALMHDPAPIIDPEPEPASAPGLSDEELAKLSEASAEEVIEVTSDVPAESASSFQLDVEASGTILGWKYDVSR